MTPSSDRCAVYVVVTIHGDNIQWINLISKLLDVMPVVS
jgi:uncharacterized Rossmann fold enzyme